MHVLYAVKLQDRVPSKGLRDRLGLDDIISVLQQNRLRWYGHMLRKGDNDWMKKCMEYEVHRQHLSCDVCLEVRGEIIRTALFFIVY